MRYGVFAGKYTTNFSLVFYSFFPNVFSSVSPFQSDTPVTTASNLGTTVKVKEPSSFESQTEKGG
jgi:hypothetical protein